MTDLPPEALRPFDPETSFFGRQMAIGHRIRLGHDLVGYHVEEMPGVDRLVRTCCEGEPK